MLSLVRVESSPGIFALPLFATDLALRSANNGFVLVSAALVLMMTPALALFYSGFVRSRNVLNTMVMSFSAMADRKSTRLNSSHRT